ncbi:MAG: GGDEF domain-containing protein [Spirochaetae bacterium HGW-Spirochaetae-8]|jgi:diguanylate cyclase (GGDEF)-like protein/PAS domain S-box-containing protein|nr:MAG: GGDEF domain-containing protein [Spirochaetae bacterium HGW-Spirochaetae-8]
MDASEKRLLPSHEGSLKSDEPLLKAQAFENQLDQELIASETRYRRLFESAQDGILIIDAQTGQIIDVNPFLAKLLGYSKEVFIGKRIWEIGPLKDIIASMENFMELQRNDYIRYEDLPLETFDAQKIEVEFVSNVYLVDGKRVIQCNIRDITDRKRLERLLYFERNLLSQTLKSIGDGVVSTDAAGKVVMVNKVAETLTGWTEKMAHGKPLNKVAPLINTAAKKKFCNITKKVLKSGNLVEFVADTQLFPKDGPTLPVEGCAAPITMENGEIAGVVVVFRDCSEKKKALQSIEYLSYHDQLTGLYNRRFYDGAVNKLESEKFVPLTLMMIDVNGLKLTNDAFGHTAGDNLLKRIADILIKVCRDDDVVARIGGDEFVLILPETDALHADVILRRINAAILCERIDTGMLSVSIGLGYRMDEPEGLRSAYKNAEDAMYRHKLYESTSMRSRTIDLITNTLFEKSPRESIHSKRVGTICEALAIKMEMTADAVNRMRVSGLMHDIGKIGVPETILNKPSGLTFLEWDEMKRHPEIGYRILLSAPQYYEVADCVLAHHERWDGKGYPKGLRGEEIPLQARIVALADSFEAMMSDRPYKKALNLAQAVMEIQKCAGFQFDPDVVRIFMESSEDISQLLA